VNALLAFLRSPSPGIVRAGRLAAALAVPAMILLVVSPLLLHPWTLGEHNWDQMNTQREVVVQTLARFHQFPFWDPYTCGGHPAWGSLESDPIVVSPWLPVYLLAPLPIAIRIEIIVSAIVGALGAWRLAARFTDSRAIQSLFTVVTVVNSRWAMQIAAGHSWHLLYGLLPWILYLFDRAIDPKTSRRDTVRHVVVAGLCLALMVYGDGIYPVPHTAFALTVYAVFVAKNTRRILPLYALAGLGVVALGLSAPKLVPLFEELQRFPRIIKSDEAIFPAVHPHHLHVADQRLRGERRLRQRRPVARVGSLRRLARADRPRRRHRASRGERERALKWAGLVMFSFVALAGPHPITPWRLLHLLPVFKSQHVPGRWLYASVTVLACCAASGADRWLRGKSTLRPGIEALLGFVAVALALDMGTVAREPSRSRSSIRRPPCPPPSVAFHMVHRLAPRPDYAPGLWDVSTLPGVLDNVGTLECDTDNGLHTLHRDPRGACPA
jgi:hypothetical protein